MTYIGLGDWDKIRPRNLSIFYICSRRTVF
nr:MAG TPA: hypothetical protein [Caudoviricetes sp.]